MFTKETQTTAEEWLGNGMSMFSQVASIIVLVDDFFAVGLTADF